MNPVAVVIIILALFFIVIGFKGKQDNVIAAFLGKQWGKSSIA